ncbi:hypothetical protein [Brevibacillus porteri]
MPVYIGTRILTNTQAEADVINTDGNILRSKPILKVRQHVQCIQMNING